MCGILGIYVDTEARISLRTVENALKKLEHRGPDDNGYQKLTVGEGAAVLLGHTRLSIIDISEGGHQPMRSSSGHVWIVFNGEIYNYKELRIELEATGVSFRTDSDTEVLLAAWEKWGPESLLKLVGMYAFAVLDLQRQTLTCVRDPFGIKPLFYTKPPAGGFAFASEISSLLELSGTRPTLNWQKAYEYLTYGVYDFDDATMFDGVHRLLPAHYIQIDLRSGVINDPVRYWEPECRVLQELSFSDAADLLRQQILHDVRLHMRSDVPIGAALSGGIDSSIVVCAMRHVEPSLPLHTFTYVERGPLSEKKWADMINNHVRAISHYVMAEPEDLLKDMETLIAAQGEPFGSTSIYAQLRIFRAAKEAGIKVVLEGQGADELYAGYHGYPGARLKSLVANSQYISAIRFLYRWSKWPGRTATEAIKGFLRESLHNKWSTRLRALGGSPPMPRWLNANEFQQRNLQFGYPLIPQNECMQRGKYLAARQAHAMTRHGLPHLLRHGDRNAMCFSVENRVPFLTTKAAEFALRLPESYLVSDQGETKCILRHAMRGIVPDEVLWRRDKIGFETKQAQWMKTIYRDYINLPWSEDLQKILNKSALAGAQIENHALQWRVMNFIAWMNVFGVRA